MGIIDIHTHLNSKSSEANLFRAVVSLEPTEFKAISCKEPYLSVGIHPWSTANGDFISESCVERLERFAADSRVVAIGECGLDPLRGASIEVQLSLFRRHIDISERLCKPLIIHQVRSMHHIISMKRLLAPKMAWILHGFRGSKAAAEQLLSCGIYLSMGRLHSVDALRAVPLNRLLIESDGAYSINEVLDRVANELGLPAPQLEGIIEDNVERILCYSNR